MGVADIAAGPFSAFMLLDPSILGDHGRDSEPQADLDQSGEPTGVL